MGTGSGSNPLSAFTSQASSALGGLSSSSSNGGDPNAITDMSGFDVSNLFSNLFSDSFDQSTATTQATQALTPPAQAQAAAAAGQDPAASLGGTETGTQTASTGPGQNQNQPNQPSQEQQEQEQRNKGIDELRRLLNRRQKQQQQPPQWHPRYAGDQQTAAAISPQSAIDAGLSAPNISPDAAVRAGLLDPSLIDPATGTIRRDQPAPAEEDPTGSSVEISPRAPPQLPDPSGPTGSGQVVPRAGTDVLPPKTVPGTPGGPPAITFKPGEPIPTGGGGGIPGLPGLGGLPWWLEGGGLGIATVPLSATPAETGEFTPAEPNFVRPDAPVGTHGLPAPKDPPDPPLPPPRPKDQPRPKPKAAHHPQRVWVPETPGHYVPTTGNVRGPPTWVPGTPGHYVEAHRAPPAAEASPRLSEARAEAPAGAMAYNQSAQPMSGLLRDIAGLGIMPQTMAALARLSGQGGGARPSNVYGGGGTRPYSENWGGGAYVAKGDEVQRGRQYMGYLTGKGLTRQGAAALLGNAHQESNLAATLAPGGDGGTAAGMFQWRGARQAAFRRWLQANGRSESDPQAHLDFALLEMQTNPAYRASWDALHDPNMSPAQIADIIANNYEGSKRGPTQGMNNRIGFANSLLQGGGQGPVQASGGGFRITDPNPNPLTSHAYPAPGETSGAPIQATGGDART